MFPHSTLSPDLSQIDEKIVPLVKLINGLSIPTFYSCEGHSGRDITQSTFPLVILSPSYTGTEALAFLRFVGMVGVHNNQVTMKDSQARLNYVCWDFTPRGDETILMKPQDHMNFDLTVMHCGLKTLVENLEATKKWYLCNNKTNSRRTK